MFKGLPSKERVRQLAREGVFPWSALATRSCIAAATLGGVLGINDLLARISRPEFLPSKGGELSLSTAFASTLNQPLGRFVLLTSGIALVAGVLVSLLQTRGAHGRAAQRALIDRNRVTGPAGPLVAVLLSGILGAVLLMKFGSVLLETIKIEGGVILGRYMAETLREICKLVVVGSAVLAVLLVFVDRLTFLLGVKRKVRRALRGGR